MIRIGIAGIGGRMGREILAVAGADPSVRVIGGIERSDRADELQGAFGPLLRIVSDAESLMPDIDLLIDFTTPDVTSRHAAICAEHRRGLVTGTTGLSSEQLNGLRSRAATTPIFYARNMSVGVNVLLAALPGIVRALDGYDIEIVEAHHRHKVDAPSGTALALAEVIAAAVERPLEQHAVYGRHGIAPRTPGEIGIHAIRGGGNAGEHTVLIADDGEEIRISHRAFSRRTFALGAVRAARFLAGQPAGFYTMSDLIAAGS